VPERSNGRTEALGEKVIEQLKACLHGTKSETLSSRTREQARPSSAIAKFTGETGSFEPSVPRNALRDCPRSTTPVIIVPQLSPSATETGSLATVGHQTGHRVRERSKGACELAAQSYGSRAWFKSAGYCGRQVNAG
jgi:hypothetical protein